MRAILRTVVSQEQFNRRFIGLVRVGLRGGRDGGRKRGGGGILSSVLVCMPLEGVFPCCEREPEDI